MNNRLMLVVLALFFLALLASTGILAFERPASCLVDNARTREIRANEPKTPEDLLLVLKSFMDNPQMSGYDIGEKISGIARENWGEPHGTQYFPYIRGGLKAPPPDGRYPLSGGEVRSTTPYVLVDDGIIDLDEDGKLEQITLGFFKEDFCLTPPITREILGDPSSITLGDRGLSLTYDIARAQKTNSILIAFKTISKQQSSIFRRDRAILVRDQHNFPKIFKERKDSCVMKVVIFKSDRGRQ